MTDALRQMIKAMCEELVRQGKADEVTAAPVYTGRHEMILEGIFDLERVARAGLKGLHDSEPLPGAIGRWLDNLGAP